MNIRTLALAPFLLASLVLPALASTSDWTETPGGRVRVIIEDNSPNNATSNERRGALQVELQPGWKTYWRNPGDAGVPPQINIEGEAKAQIDFPAPVRFGGEDEGGIGYKQPVSLPIVFHLTAADTRLKGHVFLGVCEKICIHKLAPSAVGEARSRLRHSDQLTEQAPQALLADKGYDADAIRDDLASRNIKPVIPGRANRRVKIEYDRTLYKQRNLIERMFGRLKINRAIATRYDQLAESFISMVHIATARYWLKFVHAA
ncbi:protein-disulfide reductase DsbD domain-containing protein [Brucella anthropi]|uniref:protein-disulfide reductase DsbD domain-containing protein n=1 Tax=Brucella anthropi TaxID=529 RepID=UPI001F387914|nr:protein-disulfide reductase DsbD domain-containing protein [Brucella anthropi]